MNTRTLTILLVAAAATAGVAALVVRSGESALEGTQEKRKLFPELAARKNDVALLRVQRKDGSYTLRRTGDTWGLQDKGDYPVQMDSVRKTILALADMTAVEAKTSDPARYEKLGVQDFDAEGSKSALVTLSDKDGQPLAKLIAGKEVDAKGAAVSGQSYVRKAGEAQSWLVAGRLELHERASDWLQKEILKVAQDRVRAVEIRQPDGETLAVDRDKPEVKDFTLHDVPEGKEPTYPTVANSLGSSLEYVNLDDVVPAADVDFATGAGPIARFTTFDGLVVTATLKDQDGKSYASFQASFEEPPAAPPQPAPSDDVKPDGEQKDDAAKAAKSPEEVRQEVEELNARLSKWAYQISSYSRAQLGKKKSELVKDKTPPPAPVPPGDAAEPKPGAQLGADDKPLVIPGDLDPTIQEQIKKDLEAKGEKWVIGPPRAKPDGAAPVDASTPEAKPEAKPPDAPKPDDGAGTPPQR